MYNERGMVEGLLQHLVRKIDDKAELVGFEALTGGVSAKTTSFTIKRADQSIKKLILRQFSQDIVRIQPHVADKEFVLLDALYNAGVSVPRPYYYGANGDFSEVPHRSETSYIVIDYIDGKLCLSPPDIDGYIRALAAKLVTIHSVDLNLPQFENIHWPEGATVYEAWKKPSQPMDDSLQEPKIRKFFEWAPDYVSRDLCLIHGDLWPGNLICNEAGIAGIIDWEDSTIGDPLYDLAVMRLDILWAFGHEAMDRFTQYYADTTKLDLFLLPYWDLCAALRPMHKIKDWAEGYVTFGRPDITEDKMRKAHAFFVDQAFKELDSRS